MSLSDYVSISGAVSCQEDPSHLPVELRAMSPDRKAKAIQVILTFKYRCPSDNKKLKQKNVDVLSTMLV